MRLLLLLTGLALTSSALALEYRALKDNAILYDAPSIKGVKYFIIARGTPVEIVLTQNDWIKVRDSSGNMAWVGAGAISSLRTVLVRVDKAEVRTVADDKSAIIFSAEKNVVLELVDTAPPGWAKVNHRDAQGSELSGYVKASQVWGL